MNSALLRQQNTLSLLSQQLSSSKQHNTLTEYTPTEAHNILDLQNGVTQKDGYISAISNVQQRLSMYDTTMTDIEKFAAQGISLATQNQTFDSTKVDNVDLQATNYLKELTNDLNQQIGGRYIYSGTRYNKAPVIDLSTVTGTPTATPTSNSALPTYDVDYNNATSFQINSTPSNNLTIGNVGIAWSTLATGGPVANVLVNGVPTALTTPVALPAAATPTALANNVATLFNAIATDPVLAGQGISQLSITAASGAVTMNFNGSTPLPVQPTTGGTAGQITWLGGPKPDGTISETFTSPAFTLTGLPTGNFKISNVSIPWSDIAAGSVTSVDVAGSPFPVTVSGLSTGGTTADLTANLASVLNQIASQVPAGSNLSTLSANATGTGVSLNWGAGTPQAVTPDGSPGGSTGEILWDLGSTPDGTVTQTPSSSIPAWTEDTALIDSGFSVQYGITSNDPAFQKLINGLRFINAAVTAGKAGNTATYQSDMQQASTLLTDALAGIQSLHSQAINNQNTMKNETDLHNQNITDLKNQLTNIQQVNLTQVGTEINLLQTQMQASYSSTASIQQLSLVKYL
jgi:flagellin-like hook-associated protein FlgL